MECFSQDRDELVMVFAQAKGKTNYYRPFYLKTTLRPEFSGLLFPEVVQRARTNSIDLFGQVIGVDPDDTEAIAEGETAGRIVTGVRSFLNERCLGIELEDGYTLVFKFFGNRPNLLAFQGNDVVESFNQKLVSDQNLKLDAIDRLIDQSYEAFEQAGFDHKKLFPTFGKEVNAYLKAQSTVTETEKEVSKNPIDNLEKWKLLQSVLTLLEKPTYYLTTFDHHPTLSLVPIGEIRQTFDSPIEALNRFYVNYAGLNFFEREKGEVLRLLDKRLKRAESQIEANLQRLISHEEGASHEEIANILMANLHAIEEQPGQRSPERVELYDFYRDQPIQIKLKTDLSPQRNAEGYYRKAKNEKIELDYIQQQIEQREREVIDIQQHKLAIAEITSLKAFRKYAKQHNILADGGPAATPAELFKIVNHEGYTILIGRNAKNNDLLTQRYAFKEDLWLHARDVSGSHVVVKHQAGKRFPKTVIERAAELAAWNSKRRTDSLCPVIMTPKKFVRKPKGLAEGQVVVDKEEVVMVVPRG